jgi:hypothetical protein
VHETLNELAIDAISGPRKGCQQMSMLGCELPEEVISERSGPLDRKTRVHLLTLSSELEEDCR